MSVPVPDHDEQPDPEAPAVPARIIDGGEDDASSLERIQVLHADADRPESGGGA